MNFNTREVNQLIQTRRSVFPKDYTGEKVDHQVIQQMLENATWAPSHKMTEPWRFSVFVDEGLNTLAQFQADCYKQVTSRDGSFREERYAGLRSKPMQSSCIISVGMKRDEKKSVPEIEEMGAVFCAVENMYLTATAYGVGCYISTGGITYFEEAKEFFGLGSEDRLLGFLHLGIPASWPVGKKRNPAAEISKWVKS